MGKKIDRTTSNSPRSKTLPSSPFHSFSSSSSSSSSDFEFRISVSPRKSSAALCPADELFYKGQLLPLHLSTRISMVRTLLLSSSSTSSSATATTASRDSSSSTDSSSADFSLLAPGDPCCDSSRPSSVTDDDDPLKRLNPNNKINNNNNNNNNRSSSNSNNNIKMFNSSRYFSFARMFKKDGSKSTTTATVDSSPAPGKKMSSSAKEMIRKYLTKVKPLYEKLSQNKQQQQSNNGGRGVGPTDERSVRETGDHNNNNNNNGVNISSSVSGMTFSGSLKYCPRMIRRSYVASCPSSMRSSPTHSGVLTRGGLPARVAGSGSGSGSGSYCSDTATMEELQNAIQGAITHCKNSMLQQNSAGFSHQSNNKYKGKSIEI